MTYSPLDKPESIATVFVEAWARRDAEKLASLFDEDAEFVGRAFTDGRQPPAVRQLVALEDADHDVGVADVDGEEHTAYGV